MELFASPMACSLASHITALEAGLPVKVRFVENKKTDDGGDYYKISAKGYVPALRLDDGQILNEGPVGAAVPGRRRKPESGLAPAWGTLERYQLIDTLNYLVDRAAQAHLLPTSSIPTPPSPTKEAARALFEPTLDYLAQAARQRRLPRRQQVHRGRRLSRDHAELVRLPRRSTSRSGRRSPPIHQKHLKRPSVVQAMGVEMAERQRRAA